MKKQLLKSAALAVFGIFIIGSFFGAKAIKNTKSTKKPPRIVAWSLDERHYPFVDLNLEVKVDGDDYVNELDSGSGSVPLPAGTHDVLVTTTSYSPWPTGGSATLNVSGFITGTGSVTIYNHTTSTWNFGVIDSCHFSFSGPMLNVMASSSY